jgi:hypothetical protein
VADKITTYTPETAREILRRLDRLEQRQSSLLTGGYNQAFPMGPLVVRWGQTTTTADYPTYPTSGNVVAVKFGDYEPSPFYPGSTATKTFTAYDPEVVVYATTESGEVPDEGSVVRLTWRNGKWWITPDVAASPIKWGSFWLDSSDDVTSGSPDYLWMWDNYGDLSSDGIDITVNTGWASDSDPILTMNQAGTYLFVWYWDGEHVNVSAPTTKQFTTSTAGHNHTVDIDWCWRMQTQVAVIRQASGGGGWDYGPAGTANIRLARGFPGGNLGMAPAFPSTIHASVVDHSIAAGDKIRVEVSGGFDTPTSGTLKITTNAAWLSIIRLGDADTG